MYVKLIHSLYCLLPLIYMNYRNLYFAGVGKSCLLLRFTDDSFTTSFITTIGCVTISYFSSHPWLVLLDAAILMVGLYIS